MLLNEINLEFSEITRRKQYQLMCLLLSQNISLYPMFVYQNEQPLLHNLLLEKQVEETHYIINLIQEQCQNPLEILDQRNSIQQTPLMFACYYGLTSIIKHLLKLGANINAKDQSQFSPLLFAMKNNHSYIVIYLIFKGAELNQKDLNGCSLAHWAAYNNNIFILKILKNIFKFNIFEKDKKQKTPFQRAQEQFAYECQFYIKGLLQNKKVQSNFYEIKARYQKHFNFLLQSFINVYFLILFINFNDEKLQQMNTQIVGSFTFQQTIIVKITGYASYFMQIFNLLFNYIFFFLIDSSPQQNDSLQQSSSNQSSLNISGEVVKEFQGCLEIDQSCVPLIQDEQSSNLSLTQISEGYFELQKPLIKYILNAIDCNKSVGLEFDQMCLDCFTIKLPRTQHCDYCGVCHSNYQLRSAFYFKCLQNDWTFQFYFSLLVTQLISFLYYLCKLQQQNNIYLDSIDFSYQSIEFNADYFLSVTIFFIASHYFLYILVLLFSIVSRKTYFELMNIEKCWYRYKTIIQSNHLAIRVLK